jgi:hypothetical protein
LTNKRFLDAIYRLKKVNEPIITTLKCDIAEIKNYLLSSVKVENMEGLDDTNSKILD